MKSERIPALLLTGALGSGKTTLLAAWLRQPPLRNAALIVNEIGEVALDPALLQPMTQASDDPAAAAAALSAACVCCTGLAGLQEALADLWRARLERRVPRFDIVVIETTGLARPQPIREAFASDPLLRERFALAGVVSAVSAVAPRELLAREEARAQLEGADVVVLTKVDRIPDDARLAALRDTLAKMCPQARCAESARASLRAEDVLRMLEPLESSPDAAPAPSPSPSPAHEDDRHGASPHGDHAHVHDAAHAFVELPSGTPRAVWAMRLDRCVKSLGAHLLRIKGVVVVDDGAHVLVQWAPGDAQPAMAPHDGSARVRPGVTVIASDDGSLARAAALLHPGGSSDASGSAPMRS